MSYVIVLATSKGGAGKTTLATSLAAHWYNLGNKVAIIDADPQGSIIKSYDPDGPMGCISVFSDPEVTVVNMIKEKKSEYDIIIVDTGGFSNQTAAMAIVSSDLVLIPCKTSALDIQRAIETHGLIKDLNFTPERSGNPITYRMILTMTVQGTVIARQVKQDLKEMGYLLIDSELHNRVVYQEGTLEALPPNLLDQNSAAAMDVASIAREISSIREKHASPTAA
ncbi:MAG: ParA family protein [Simkaniaceae bacterium]|nr:ParA family protein [Simkaniaceae bacterium]